MTKADFEHQYHHHFMTPNRYCRYGDIELYAPSEEGAAAILKAVAEPLVRCQSWLRLGNGLNHILLYELLKVFSALGGDRELVLAGSEELDALAQLTASQRPVHVSSSMKSRGHQSVAKGVSVSAPGSSTSHGTLDSGSSNRNGNGSAFYPSNGDGLDHSNDNSFANGYTASSTSPGFLLLRTSPRRDHNPALEDTTTAGLRAALNSGAASPLLLVEVTNDGYYGVSSDGEGRGDPGSIRPNCQTVSGREGGGGGDDGATAPTAKYRLWARMMEAALHSGVTVPAGAATAATAGRYGSRHGSRPGVARQESGNHNGNEQARPIVVWGLLTDLKRWRFYCLREAPRLPDGSYGSSGGGGGGGGSGKYEILGSRRVRVLDESMSAWPGLVPALAALYAITCTSDGLAVRRVGDVSQALTYDMPHDPHRDRLMHFHLIMGAAKAPLYGAVGDWVRRRLDEYVQCQREQKRLRHAAEATVQKAAEAVAAARGAAAAAVADGASEAPTSTFTSTSASLADGPAPAAGDVLPATAAVMPAAAAGGPEAGGGEKVLHIRSADAGSLPAAAPPAHGAQGSAPSDIPPAMMSVCVTTRPGVLTCCIGPTRTQGYCELFRKGFRDAPTRPYLGFTKADVYKVWRLVRILLLSSADYVFLGGGMCGAVLLHCSPKGGSFSRAREF
ncbi:hypothetical protein VOLCADRAFT_89426 [Volvox carteri f. nagariensis]|uniref:Uncharacterized protein n=1 Tax=Volvox carteri f. nagariensis TaxID=3068 RepID=D8TRN7_VOLCA|nr:uncharacterized protein VOLCADRAFT_89426 [Volvox carteri f. nagariensis]EFJ50023.1 hypothetical protein VOLCADRAFT_89426 [Volvox carteri f. nagariensis]|eukprot:XP_002949088.1 hypothetical protein VOLCADRAFT_89426 [Volvox carteri f. nagariensis]